MSFSVQTDISPISKQLYMLLLFIFKSTMKCLSISAELNTGSSCYLKHLQSLQGISAARIQFKAHTLKIPHPFHPQSIPIRNPLYCKESTGLMITDYYTLSTTHCKLLQLSFFQSKDISPYISAERDTVSSCYLNHPQYLQGISAAKEYHTDDRVPFLTLRTSHRLQRPVTQNPGRQSFVRSITFRSRNLTLKPTALPRQLSGHRQLEF